MVYESLFELMKDTRLEPWLEIIEQQIADGLDHMRHGDLPRWQEVISRLPEIETAEVNLNGSAITIKSKQYLDEQTKSELKKQLQQLMPWRKGPYSIHGIEIDTEWHSDWKWDRVKQHILPLKDKTVLDVGCGNGYHGWRMIGEQAQLVIGVDPSPLFIMQYQAVKHYAGNYPLYVLPVGIQDLPARMHAFDTVFSMGVLYHRRSPIDHLMQLKSCLKPGGQLVLETLVIDGDINQVLVPEDRYAKMRNVWFIPSTDAMCHWLKRCGYHQITLVDVNTTSIEEQRATEWMPYESLVDFLNPENAALTVEGYPAPRRAVFTAIAP